MLLSELRVRVDKNLTCFPEIHHCSGVYYDDFFVGSGKRARTFKSAGHGQDVIYRSAEKWLTIQYSTIYLWSLDEADAA